MSDKVGLSRGIEFRGGMHRKGTFEISLVAVGCDSPSALRRAIWNQSDLAAEFRLEIG